MNGYIEHPIRCPHCNNPTLTTHTPAGSALRLISTGCIDSNDKKTCYWMMHQYIPKPNTLDDKAPVYYDPNR